MIPWLNPTSPLFFCFRFETEALSFLPLPCIITNSQSPPQIPAASQQLLWHPSINSKPANQPTTTPSNHSSPTSTKSHHKSPLPSHPNHINPWHPSIRREFVSPSPPRYAPTSSAKAPIDHNRVNPATPWSLLRCRRCSSWLQLNPSLEPPIKLNTTSARSHITTNSRRRRRTEKHKKQKKNIFRFSSSTTHHSSLPWIKPRGRRRRELLTKTKKGEEEEEREKGKTEKEEKTF